LIAGLLDHSYVDSLADMTPAQKTELATLVQVLLLEIATVLANGEIGNDQDHL